MTTSLLAISKRPIPSPSADVLRLTNPVSLSASIRASDELALTSFWGVATLVVLVLMFALSIALGRVGLTTGGVLAWFSFAGVVLHGFRHEVAEIATRRLESRYKRAHGRTSRVDAAAGKIVKDESPSIILGIVSSSDWDFVVQLVISVGIALALR